jgi:phosphomannomutase
MTRSIGIASLMESSGVKFGTSGARGLVTAMTDEICFAYTAAFLQYLEHHQRLPPRSRVALAGDLRPSTGRILSAVAHAVTTRGHRVVHCGRIPSPSVALFGLSESIPAIMVTGSHIPEDRNGIKFNSPDGEILKHEERGIREQTVDLPDDFDESGMLLPGRATPLPAVDDAASKAAIARLRSAFPPDCLAGLRLGIYGHSAVGRDMLVDLYASLGAQVVRLDWSDHFVPVDTEAIRPRDVELAASWAAQQHLDSIVSTDGDSDRPLVSDERGRWLRGDVAGILCARFLRADAVVAPISCNTALESCGSFARILRTRIGSPYVIEGMMQAVREGASRVVGYEANGGFLTMTDLDLHGRLLSRLPTRDAMIVHLAILSQAASEHRKISALVADLPARYTASDRLQDFPTDLSRRRIDALQDGGARAIEAAFPAFGPVRDLDKTDGLRIRFASGEIVHLRPSGNAPELRCYTEAATEDRARQLNVEALTVLSGWR